MKKNVIILKKESDFYLEHINEIQFCESQGNYSTIHMRNGDSYRMRWSLKYLEGLLPDHLFIRISRSVLVNTHCIKQMRKMHLPGIVMKDQKEFSVSRRKKTHTQNAFLLQTEQEK